MKEYIYLDEDALNSTLSQIDGGLLAGISKAKGQGSARQNSGTKATEKGIDGPWILGAKYVKEVSEESGMELTKNQQRTLDYVLNDHAVDYLLEKLKPFPIFKKDILETEEGDIVYFESKFSLYDFSLIKEISSPENTVMLTSLDNNEEKKIDELKKKVKLMKSKLKQHPEMRAEIDSLEEQMKLINERKDIFNIIFQAAKFSENILGGSLLIKSNNSLSLCKREAFRLNKGQLAMLVDSKRQIKIFGTILADKDEVHPDGDFNELQSSEMNKIPSMFTDLFLSNFGLINSGDKIIKPIAIFFE